MLSHLRRRLAWKLFLSYLIVIVVGVIVLATAAELSIPDAFNRHLAMMGAMMGSGQGMNLDLLAGFRAALNESLAVAALAATAVAVLVSVLVSRQVVAPVRAMQRASQRIASGEYDERVRVPGDPAKGDLDELGELALHFNQMASRLAQVEAMRRQLIGDVAHELRTPLTAIKGTMEALIDDVLPADKETYQQVYREADRLQRLVNDLQELSRVEARAYPLDRRPLAVGTLMTTLVSRLGRQFEDKGVSLRADVPADLPPVLGDEDRLGQVLLNLVGNALQYTPAGGSVVVSARRKDREVQIAVTDTGLGIAAEHLPHVFDRFYRVDKSRSRAAGGSGIGLTIARHLVEAHGGKLRAESAGPGQGSTFTFSLPVAA
jgi:signal transduction histidine kinase